jgi:hypothetical protein
VCRNDSCPGRGPNHDRYGDAKQLVRDARDYLGHRDCGGGPAEHEVRLAEWQAEYDRAAAAGELNRNGAKVLDTGPYHRARPGTREHLAKTPLERKMVRLLDHLGEKGQVALLTVLGYMPRPGDDSEDWSSNRAAAAVAELLRGLAQLPDTPDRDLLAVLLALSLVNDYGISSADLAGAIRLEMLPPVDQDDAA